MSRRDFKGFRQPTGTPSSKPPVREVVPSLLDVMQDGNEYGSVLNFVPSPSMNVREEIRRAMADVAAIRQRPLLLYAANVLKANFTIPVGIVLADDLPFAEMVDNVDGSTNEVDVVIVTGGGLAQQVAQFVNRLRRRFDHVAYIVPHVAMSAGTIWVMSGDDIWMDERASLGPIDPQVPGKDGRFLPAQAILTLLDNIRERGEARLKAGSHPDWTDQLILRNMDPKEIGDAHNFSLYSIQLVTNYLENFKFRSWIAHSNGTPVTVAEKRNRAVEIAAKLCNHGHWKTHSHGISRDVLWNELKLKIRHPEEVAGLGRAIRRLWALLYWIFDNTQTAKILLSKDYVMFRNEPNRSVGAK